MQDKTGTFQSKDRVGEENDKKSRIQRLVRYRQGPKQGTQGNFWASGEHSEGME